MSSRRPDGGRKRGGAAPVLVAFVGACLFLLAWYGAGNQSGASRRPAPINLVLVSIDTLRADRLSAYGYERATSPVLERLASEGVLFEEFYYNGGGTLPSHMTLFTSMYPATHGIEPGRPDVLPDEATTLTEVLRDAGYRTAAFVDPGWLNPKYGFGQGFELYDDRGHRLRATLPRALEWLDENRGHPYFLFLHTYDVHSTGLGESLPYSCPAGAEWRFVATRPEGYDGCGDGYCGTKRLKFLNERSVETGSSVAELMVSAELDTVSSLYDGCIRYVDGQIGELLDHLRDAGELEKTMIVVLSDHGEEFAEHGRLMHEQGGYEELARIPWILRLPASRFAGTRVRGLSAMADVMPTILELLGLPVPTQSQGSSWANAIAEGATSRRWVHMYAVLRFRDFKYFSDQRLLFDLARDPSERSNVYDSSSQLTSQLELRVRSLIEEDLHQRARLSQSWTSGHPVTLDEEEIRRLRALGYLR